MNIHPLIVHFPIALLAMYALFELLPLERWYPRAAWADIKAILVCFGGVGILAALLTGQVAEAQQFGRLAASILHLHKFFAEASVSIFGLIALGYFIRWAESKHGFPFGKSYSRFMQRRWVAIMFALVGLTTLFLTGAFGAMIVYGPGGDIITQVVANVFKPLL